MSFEGTSTNLTNAEKQDIKHILGHNIVKLKLTPFWPLKSLKYFNLHNEFKEIENNSVGKVKPYQ